MDERNGQDAGTETSTDLGKELQRIWRRQKETDPESVLSPAKIAKRVGQSKTMVWNTINGKSVPNSPEVLGKIARLLGATADDLNELHQMRNRIVEPSRTLEADEQQLIAPAGPAPALAPAAPADAAPEVAPPPRRTPRLSRILLGAVLVLAGTAVLLLPGQIAESNKQPDDYETIDRSKVSSAPVPARAIRTCEGRKTAGHHFPDDYVGDVWVRVTSPTGLTLRSEIDLKWGGSRWIELVKVHAGDNNVLTARGGTMLMFKKWDHESPGLSMTATEPVCVQFGTKRTTPLPVPALRIETTGWR